MQILIKATCECSGKKSIPFYNKDMLKLENYTTSKDEAIRTLIIRTSTLRNSIIRISILRKSSNRASLN